MSSNQNEAQIGASIRRARRERNMTQTQLGGIRYSKSYISAIEHAKILPSQQTLQFLASQLHLPLSYFTDSGKQEDVALVLDISAKQHQILDPSERVITDELCSLLGILLEGEPRWNGRPFSGLPPFSIEALDAVPASRQATYAFLLGTLAQQKEDFNQAVRAFEYALQRSPPQQHPAILNALGSTYALQRLDSLALHYHLQAHLLLNQQKLANSSSPLHLTIPLHCAQDYRALGNYQQASAMYEDARLHLNARNSMEIAADLYLGLGYCVYGMVCNVTKPATSPKKSLSINETEQGYQRAFSLLLDSISLSLLAGNRGTEIAARLLLCTGVLDWCASLYLKRSNGSCTHGEKVEEHCDSLLNKGEEHCHQILLTCQEDFIRGNVLSDEEKQSIFPALASLVRLSVQRAGMARIRGNAKTALRELALASSLCNHTLHSLCEASFPASCVELALARLTACEGLCTPVIPTLPDKAPLNIARSALDKVEVYLAAGEVAEELGRAAEKSNDAANFYEQANHFYLAALEHASSVITRREQDPGYLTRCYQRCIALLEERVAGVQVIQMESTRELLHFFKSELQRLPDPALSVDS